MIYPGFIRSPSSSNLESAKVFFKKAIRDGLEDFFDTHGFDIEAWISNEDKIDGRSRKVISKYLKAFTMVGPFLPGLLKNSLLVLQFYLTSTLHIR